MSAPQVFLTETRERFLNGVVAELPPERIRELYLFAPIRQGGVESGVAVIAVLPLTTEGDEISESVAPPTTGSDEIPESVAPPTLNAVEILDSEAEPTLDPDGIFASAAPPTQPRAPTAERYTVYTARYRHTLKGPDRGKWDASIVAEADAPLLSIETVVRGVQRRAGDVEPPDHMTGDELRTALRLTPPDAAA